MDIGVGNAYPVKEFLGYLLSKGILGKYIGIDMSPDMLNVAERNVNEWFGDKVNFEKYEIDVSNTSFRELLFGITEKDGNESAVNLVCYVGSSIENMESNDNSLDNVKKSLGKNDILLLGRTLDSDNSKEYFDFSEKNPEQSNSEEDNDKWKWFIENLGITEDCYTYQMLYDDVTKSRIGQMKLEKDLDIIFETTKFRKIVSFSKGDSIITWRHRHHSYKEIIDEMQVIGMQILQTSVSMDREQILIISSLKTSR